VGASTGSGVCWLRRRDGQDGPSCCRRAKCMHLTPLRKQSTQQMPSIVPALPSLCCATVGAGRPWQFLMSQTVLSQIKAPKLAATVRLQPRLLAWVCRCGAPPRGPWQWLWQAGCACSCLPVMCPSVALLPFLPAMLLIAICNHLQ
jgi:hypothetical protein